jgi:alpha-1,6-mannosyltransferase
VPRTFVGALALAQISRPILALTGGKYAQFVVRGILGLFNAFTLLLFRARLDKAFGKDVGRWYILLQAAQFHVIFYASRTLPNTFAFGLSEFIYLTAGYFAEKISNFGSSSFRHGYPSGRRERREKKGVESRIREKTKMGDLPLRFRWSSIPF